MSNNQKHSSTNHQRAVPLTEERGLQPARNPPPMPQVKPTKSESSEKK
jgi:hypothetical protein